MSADNPAAERPELLKTCDVLALIGFSKASLFRRLADGGSFPRPVRVEGSRLLRWRRADVMRWIEKLQPHVSPGEPKHLQAARAQLTMFTDGAAETL